MLHMFFLAMALNPHVVRNAQEELDRILGGRRLPDFSDQEQLPYISAIVKELLRWGCPVPIGVPKRVRKDDNYKGYFIPAGAIILENIWLVQRQNVRISTDHRSLIRSHILRKVFRDESIYPKPEDFDPERFLKGGKLDPSVRDPEERVFGAGRRCGFCDCGLPAIPSWPGSTPTVLKPFP